MIYKELIIKIKPYARDSLIGEMLLLGFEGFSDTDEALYAFIPANRWNDSLIDRIKDIISGHKTRYDKSPIAISVRDVFPQNWQEQWEKSIEPIEIGERIVVHPSWKQIENSPDLIDVIIDPKMAFGTGHHETTRMMIRLLEQFSPEGKSVLDVGTGTGILAIVASKLKASIVVGIDNDPDAYKNACENASLNKVTDIVKIFPGTLERVPEYYRDKFDIILANLDRATILLSLEMFNLLLAQNGMLLISGLLEENIPEIKLSLQKYNATIVQTLSEKSITDDVWTAIAVRR